MKIYTVAHSTNKKSESGTDSLKLDSFYNLSDALDYYEMKKDQLEAKCFEIVSHWYSLDDEFLTFEEMAEKNYLSYIKDDTANETFIKRLSYFVRGTQHHLAIVCHEVMKFN